MREGRRGESDREKKRERTNIKILQEGARNKKRRQSLEER